MTDRARVNDAIGIEVFADVVCPFTHVGLRRLQAIRRARARHQPSLRVRAWPLEWINGRPIDLDLVAEEVCALRRDVAPGLFRGFDPGTFPRTSLPAFGLASAAYAVSDVVGEAVSLMLRDALFEHGVDVSDERVLQGMARELGVRLLGAAALDQAVRVDWERGRARGVKGSPHFFVGDRDWFCPSLDITHAGTSFEIRSDTDTAREFFAAAVA